MSSYNAVTLLGNLGAEPELKYTPSGKAVANFRLAVNERYTDAAGQQHRQAHWFSVSCWEKLAELAGLYLVKGSRVLVSGRLTSRSYEADDGSKRYAVDVVALNLVFLDGARESAGSLDHESAADLSQPALPL
jgi:single-strand DNA-binding protein